MKPSKRPDPANPEQTTLECPCGWSRKTDPGENAEKTARYHRIIVHNDQEAVRAHAVY